MVLEQCINDGKSGGGLMKITSKVVTIFVSDGMKNR